MYSISVDSHVTEPGDCYAPRIDPRFRDRAPVEQDRDGVAAEVLYPSVGMLLCNHPDADFKKACPVPGP